MSTIGKIIIAIALVYIFTVFLILDLNDLSWKNNSENYFKLIAAVLLIIIQFRNRKSKK